jgi:outer membrane protein OmpA-like peptidoglycan-associated protein
MRFKLILVSCLLLTLPAIVIAQVVTESRTIDNTQIRPLTPNSITQLKVVARTITAINYPNRGGSTRIDFRGTDLMPRATGDAKVESKSGRTSIESHFEHLRPAPDYGPEFLTYVLWAITPQGRPANLGEVIPNHDGKISLNTATDFQSFGMIVTAEPYFAVTRPSDMLVLKNVVRSDTKGTEVPIEARFETLDRSDYVLSLPASRLPATIADRRVPLELLQARNAVAIAEAAGADQYAPSAYQNAVSALTRAEDYRHGKQGTKAVATAARAATQSAEDARLLAIQQRQRLQAIDERHQTEESRRQAAQAREDALVARQEAGYQQAQAESQRQQAEQTAREADRERAAAEQARLQAMQQQQALAADAEQARQQAMTAEQRAARAEQDKEQTRQRLLTQLNEVLQTRDTARGLIVDMNDVLFDTGKATLKSEAKLRLAKVAGIIEAYPDLHLRIEGYTDSTGSPELNRTLSERRAATVRDFLIAQGVPVNNVVAQGFGAENPIASNTTPQGRQMNRRVDLVVRGQTIGNEVGEETSPASGSSAAQQ